MALLCIGLIAFMVVLLAVALYIRTGTLTGQTGLHGDVMASILIVYVIILAIVLLVVYCHRRLGIRRGEGSDAEESSLNTEENILSHEGFVNANLWDRQAFSVATDAAVLRVNNQEDDRTAGSDHQEGDDEIKKKSTRKVKQVLLFAVLPLTILILILAEVYFILVWPTASIFPLQTIRVQDAIATSPDGGWLLPAGCDVAAKMEHVRDFFKNNTSIDFDQVQVVVGGAPVNFNKKGYVGAMVFENTIHLKANVCPRNALLLHEMIHVYQFNTGWFYGKKGLRRVSD